MSSSSRINTDKEDCVELTTTAAAVKLPVSATAMNARICLSVIFIGVGATSLREPCPRRTRDELTGDRLIASLLFDARDRTQQFGAPAFEYAFVEKQFAVSLANSTIDEHGIDV